MKIGVAIVVSKKGICPAVIVMKLKLSAPG